MITDTQYHTISIVHWSHVKTKVLLKNDHHVCIEQSQSDRIIEGHRDCRGSLVRSQSWSEEMVLQVADLIKACV